MAAGMKSGLIDETKRDDSCVIPQDSLSLGFPFLDPLPIVIVEPLSGPGLLLLRET